MKKPLRTICIQALWEQHRQVFPHIKLIEQGLKPYGIATLPLDHFACIDLPGLHTGIPALSSIFSSLGYVKRGQGYLPDKINDFTWMAEEDCEAHRAHQVLPQVVVADFRLDDMPLEIKKIIEKYAALAPSPPLHIIDTCIKQYVSGKLEAQSELINVLLHYFSGRDWPLPSKNEFLSVNEFNELLAWVLIMGRKINHFGLAIHLLERFKTLEDFNQLIEDKLHLALNEEGGIIKGGKAVGIAQSGTRSSLQKINLFDGHIQIPSAFVEFVFRYPRDPACLIPLLWKDFFTGFIGEQANTVIESLIN
jgi:hypothetical protein